MSTLPEDAFDPSVFDSLPVKLNVNELAYLLSVSTQTVTRLISEGELPASNGYVKKRDLIEFIERHFVVNIPVFSAKENLEAYLKKNKTLPILVDPPTIEFILNEVPEDLKKYPGYTRKGIPRDQFLAYLNRTV